MPTERKMVDCPTCGGGGMIETKPFRQYGPEARDEQCYRCAGYGTIPVSELRRSERDGLAIRH